MESLEGYSRQILRYRERGDRQESYLERQSQGKNTILEEFGAQRALFIVFLSLLLYRGLLFSACGLKLYISSQFRLLFNSLLYAELQDEN